MVAVGGESEERFCNRVRVGYRGGFEVAKVVDVELELCEHYPVVLLEDCKQST